MGTFSNGFKFVAVYKGGRWESELLLLRVCETLWGCWVCGWWGDVVCGASRPLVACQWSMGDPPLTGRPYEAISSVWCIALLSWAWMSAGRKKYPIICSLSGIMWKTWAHQMSCLWLVMRETQALLWWGWCLSWQTREIMEVGGTQAAWRWSDFSSLKGILAGSPQTHLLSHNAAGHSYWHLQSSFPIFCIL